MSDKLSFPNDTSSAAIQRHLKRIEDWAAATRKRLAELDAGLSTTNTSINNLALADLSDVDFTTPPTTGDTLVYNGSKWLPGVSTGGTEVEMGTGVPSGQAATTLLYYDQVGKRLYARNNSTVGAGAEWEYWNADGVYTEP